MTGGLWGDTKPASGVPIDLIEDEWVISGTPLEWDDWIELPVRSYDRIIRLPKGRMIRCPLCIIRSHYSKLPLKKPSLSNDAIIERDGYRCQYTGEKLSRAELNVDHVIPRHQGGKSTWDNMVASKKGVNLRKGSLTPEQAGLKLLRQPKEPVPMPLSFFIRHPRLPEHSPFFNN